MYVVRVHLIWDCEHIGIRKLGPTQQIYDLFQFIIALSVMRHRNSTNNSRKMWIQNCSLLLCQSNHGFFSFRSFKWTSSLKFDYYCSQSSILWIQIVYHNSNLIKIISTYVWRLSTWLWYFICSNILNDIVNNGN